MFLNEKVGAVIVAAGQSRRMGGQDKIFARLSGKPVLAHTLSVFQQSPEIDDIALVVSEHNLKKAKELVKEYNFSKVIAICSGGELRQDSVSSGLTALCDCGWVLIHDGARPLLDPVSIPEGLEAAKLCGSAVAAVPLKDTVKEISPEGLVEKTLPREKLISVQTPQVFRADIIQKAYRRVGITATDDAQLVEKLKLPVKIFSGAYANIKITTPEDLLMAEILLKKGR
ncbi:2-C-methyl-D-erythritol 4-phosphate cytidylyltransferase [Dehalococcoides mccartyi]|uniref:2-C-methyl-D-erythritol 4-phosphate cytidylyltransferase n=1 Tax=Dehalococcoides mccartyi (strain ATCC BAA-2266 / KCTC 15142 / 195) TaxID=243164 RepID=ISPD_DEHM1|nr:2-C-methyl-D-erythritol 4-phosphate cytidylyltransferase [Dehalococcoides mccartyi]Q3ZAD7.1 RecName: Full=2-C-methyl-D-erythritol 4-phosphate cytidylyltransferase; AltName: Full=4-diphosphocytidyl-2C-methyl-D-erythritol synthase; AltName: Full=MEP cytidylyltransferase; Short=MCT [Dehalococcoides mccartyi 195]AAW39081.1 2-C-methyl-D-erythritol 4-phosphate cytidylyltransferase [Dehalococcoides mccartyi 195]